MPSTYPATKDSFTEPSLPESTPLSSAGTGTRNHLEHHRDLGDAVEALQANAALKTHDHGGGAASPKLKQANTHESVDTDVSTSSIHHTIGPGPKQAAAGNHTHTQDQITGLGNYICTSTTRPSAPTPGLQIYETDTNRVRVWAKFPSDLAFRWVLLPVASVPIVRLLQGTAQRIMPSGSFMEWRVEEEDNFGAFDSTISMTDIVIPEPGLYSVDTSIAWNNTDIFGDQAMTGIFVNGVETPRKHWEFVRGYLFNPGFSQSVDATAKMRFKTGDRVSVVARHNGRSFQWTYSSTSAKQDSRLEIAYLAP